MIDGDRITPEFLQTIPLGRIGRPRDIAGAVAFLCGDDAAWITGQVLRVNGGLAMG
jgi:3-oxoacyl-[acyl-carrier protein] reductase